MRLPATPEQLAVLHEMVEGFWRGFEGLIANPPEREWLLQFVTAIGEIGNNIIRHAYPVGGAGGQLQLRLRLYADRIEARFIDRGIPFVAPGPTAAPVAPADEGDLDALLVGLSESGYGLALVRAALDHLDYDRTPGGQNHWQLVKLFPQA